MYICIHTHTHISPPHFYRNFDPLLQSILAQTRKIDIQPLHFYIFFPKCCTLFQFTCECVCMCVWRVCVCVCVCVCIYSTSAARSSNSPVCMCVCVYLRVCVYVCMSETDRYSAPPFIHILPQVLTLFQFACVCMCVCVWCVCVYLHVCAYVCM